VALKQRCVLLAVVVSSDEEIAVRDEHILVSGEKVPIRAYTWRASTSEGLCRPQRSWYVVVHAQWCALVLPVVVGWWRW
jgi:hypothetical protein